MGILSNLEYDILNSPVDAVLDVGRHFNPLIATAAKARDAQRILTGDTNRLASVGESCVGDAMCAPWTVPDRSDPAVVRAARLDTTCDFHGFRCRGATPPHRRLWPESCSGSAKELEYSLASLVPASARYRCTEAEWSNLTEDDPDACQFIRLPGEIATYDWGENRSCDVTQFVGGSRRRLICPDYTPESCYIGPYVELTPAQNRTVEYKSV